MKIATMVVFKDEADILPAYLKHMEEHVDYFLWLDNESSDNGAEIVKEHPKTVFFDTVEGIYTMSMKDRLWEELQKYLSNDDWVCGGAPDLFPMFDVRKQIALADSEGFHSITTHFPTFFFTLEMYGKYMTDPKYKKQINIFDPANYERYCNTSAHTIAIIKNTKDKNGRVRYTQERQEPPVIPGGKKTKLTRLCFAHYRFRSPQQMQSRMESRSKVNPNHEKHRSFQHYPTWEWKDYLIPQRRLHKFTSVKKMDMTRIKLDALLLPLDKALERMKNRIRINSERKRVHKQRQKELKRKK